MSKQQEPIQPLIWDEHKILRFRGNALVEYLLDAGPFDMNHLACVPCSPEDREQFAQLIGYSVSGFSELSYVSNATMQRVQRKVDRVHQDPVEPK